MVGEFPYGSGGSGASPPHPSGADVCVLDEIVKPAEMVLQEDLESLRRTYSEEERVEFWNMVRKAYKDFMLGCSTRFSPEVVRLVKGKLRLAMLLLAASFKLNGEGQESIIRMFKEEEYRILQDFEEFKIFDSLDVDTIVEFIKRREGKVYEAVKKYYDRQYNALDTAWGPLMGDLLTAFENRYRARRKKIEEAVVRYVRRYGLLETVSEIEEAVRKVLEAGELRRRIEEEVRRKVLEEYRVNEMRERLATLEEERERLYEHLRRLEESATSGVKEVATLAAELERVRAEKERITKLYEEMVRRFEDLQAELLKAREELAAKQAELERLSTQYSQHAGAAEALRAEAESLRNAVESLRAQAEEYRRMLEGLRTEKALLEERLREVEAALRGEVEGHVITSEEAEALAEAYLRRVAFKASPPKSGVGIYDPRSEEVTYVKEWDERRTYTLSEGEVGAPVSRGLILVKRKGLIFKRRDVVVEAVVMLHEDSYASKGFDTKPVTLAEVVEEVRRRVEDAESNGYYSIIVVASPTGFTPKAIEYVAGKEMHRTFVSRNATLYLVDLLTGEVYRSPADPAAERNEWLVKPELPEEAVRKVMDYVMSEDAVLTATASSPAEPMLLASDIATKSGVQDWAAVRVALARLEEQGLGKVIVAEGGVTAFKYSPKALTRVSGGG